MPNTNSKLAAAEDKHEDKERIQKLENELQNAREREKFWFKQCKAVQDQLNHLQQGKFYEINYLLQKTVKELYDHNLSST